MHIGIEKQSSGFGIFPNVDTLNYIFQISAKKQINVLCRLSHHLNTETKLLIYNSFIRSRKSFRYEAAHIWNSLPNELWKSVDFKEFERLIRTWEGTSCKCSMCKFNCTLICVLLFLLLSVAYSQLICYLSVALVTFSCFSYALFF